VAKHIRHVVIGNSAAALSAIKSIRETDHSSSIFLISAENCNAYSPVLITYYLSGKISRKDLFIVDDHFYNDNEVERIFGNKALELDPKKQMVYLEDGRKILYDNLLIATGASANYPNELRKNFQNVFTLRNIKDMERILKLSNKAGEIVIIGGGLVSLQIADALSKKKARITFIISSKQVLSRNIDVECASIVKKKIESRGISIYFENEVKEIKKIKDKACLITNSGKDLKADMVIIGKGVTSNTQLGQNTSIKINKGILVNDSMRTNIENIFAAGDVAEVNSLLIDESDVFLGWLNACEQGRVAGLNMVGCKESYRGGLNENISTIFGLNIAAVGFSRSNGNKFEVLKFSDHKRKVYRKLLLDNNKIMGTVLLGRIEDAGLIRNLIRRKMDISFYKDKIISNLFNLGKILIPLTNR